LGNGAEELKKLRERYVPRGVSTAHPVVADHAQGFFSTGAEAVENAVKIARAHTGRPAVISFRGSFHGRTLLALSLTGSAQPYKQNFGPYAPEVPGEQLDEGLDILGAALTEVATAVPL
jgi:4-aminobutyrate aminotransferase / (S)-3-amino-2-methylpropionate transaminase / 5-aminovalerate transaminase